MGDAVAVQKVGVHGEGEPNLVPLVHEQGSVWTSKLRSELHIEDILDAWVTRFVAQGIVGIVSGLVANIEIFVISKTTSNVVVE